MILHYTYGQDFDSKRYSMVTDLSKIHDNSPHSEQWKYKWNAQKSKVIIFCWFRICKCLTTQDKHLYLYSLSYARVHTYLT